MSEKRKLLEVSGDNHANSAAGLNWATGSHNKMIRSEFSQSWIKNCPSLFPAHCQPNKIIFCFICGNQTCEENTALIYSRQPANKPDSPFFPFMEYHDPAPGAEPMTNWSVLSCFVCNAFLVQQWQSFERFKTPINKRLYWLKRPSGCEIRQPVSQIELEEMLNENVRDVGGGGGSVGAGADQADTSDNESTTTTSHIPQQQNRSNDGGDSSLLPKLLKSEFEEQSSTSAVDTHEPQSSPKHEVDEAAASSSVNKIDPSFMVHCYCCGEAKQLNFSVCRIYIRPSYEQMRVGVPFYPTTLQHPMAEHAKVLHNSITFMCISCLPRFPPQWHHIQKDFLKQFNHPPMLPRIPLPETVTCYMCEEVIDTKFNDHLVSDDKMFDYLRTKTMMPSAVPLNFDFTYMCSGCTATAKEEIEHRASSDDNTASATSKS